MSPLPIAPKWERRLHPYPDGGGLRLMGRYFTYLKVTLLVALICQNCGRYGGVLPQDENAYAVVPSAYTQSKAEDIFEDFPQGQAAMDNLCEAPLGNDVISRVFCRGNVPRITSLRDLQNALGLGFANTGPNGQNGRGGNPGFVLTGHSSSLVAKNVSSINPRAIIFTPNVSSPRSPYTVISYSRGEQFVEIATTDDDTGNVNFYVVKFNQACNETRSCTAGDLLTPAVEKNWTNIQIYEDSDLANTILDCRQCHQPKGPDQAPGLRMQEISSPFTHFFWTASESGSAIISDFINAHGSNEDYGGIPANLITKSDPRLLSNLVQNAGFGNQPNPFPSATVEAEVKSRGFSPTWDRLFINYVRGQAIAPPYYKTRISDPSKLSVMTAAYQRFRSGQIQASQLPDIRDILPGDAKSLSEMGFRAKPGLDGQTLFTNMCMQCHNSSLDQTISRARFNVEKMDQMSAAEKNAVMERLALPQDSLYVMPPSRFRTLTEDEKSLMVQYLNRTQ
jgi:hypothetical protein